ncbi:hypothetical protein Celly_0361 [Cellulophaga lytica DSM 7489]|uniref:Uncharacterized protein n=1 Tax=Cellulophaga lytica (strain ATCC 23178 / DSM 7489 / JCM 8516 / NBRC 14961 / NCIMB 1423 / VKM B-1433 / Cy l20) TaxID=867900 RepID=F0RI70_CELLC|nr:hypothetical protein [Cellulophaga lytica]ADY28196.1 hypothetical protein Celly_0361 [Cellulophaga lytica DSM 7489]WQG77622.1 hypothetical protein SR888_01565 [Cellulophaga lytica]
MLDSIYENFSDKGLKQALAVYGGLVISTVAIPIVILVVEYFLNDKISFNKIMIIFLVIFLWSLFNIDYLKKRLKTSEKSE